MSSRITGLAEAYIADELDTESLAELESLLGTDENARLDFLARLEIHAGLAWECRGTSPIPLPSDGPEITTPGLRRHLLPIAALITLLAVAAFLLIPRSHPPEAPVATIRATLHGQWADGSEVTARTGIHAGLWELQTGLVELETRPGTVLLLEGPASIEIRDPLHARLISGNLVVRMPKGESGFIVEMPHMKVTDLGTEFGVSVSASGESRVQVFDGKVRAESSEVDRRELTAGETVLCSLNGAMSDADFDENRFIRKFPPPRPGYQPGGPLYSRSTLHSVDAAHAPRSVAIDGDLSEWNPATAFHTACEPPYQSTYFVRGSMMYDAEHLYLSARVGDPEPMKNAARPGFEFAGGSVIVRLSTDRTLGWPLKGTMENAHSPSPLPDSISNRISHLIMWHDAHSGKARLQILHGFDPRGAEIDPPGWSGVFVKDPDALGYTLEYRIPWFLLNCADDPPRPGDQLAGLWMAHWSDSEGRVCRGQLVDVTNSGTGASPRIAPFVYFQHGPTWGRVNYLPPEP